MIEYDKIAEAFERAGLEPPEHFECDGIVHRYAQSDKPKNKTSWYVLHDNDDAIFGKAGDWRLDINEKIRVFDNDKRQHQSRQDIDAKRKKMAQRKAEQDAEKARVQAAAAEKAEKLFSAAQQADEQHPYLIKKNIPSFGLRQSYDKLIAPMTDGTRSVVAKNAQMIDQCGQKRFLKGGQTSGLFYIATQAGFEKIYICEGVATAHSIAHELIKKGKPATVIAAMSAGNLPSVAKIVQGYTGGEIVVAADNDKAGIKAALEAKKITGCRLIKPPAGYGDFNDYLSEKHNTK